jgi:SAM-dependent methyltransferase
MTSVRHPASLRDPAGYLVKCGNRLLRLVRPGFVDEYRSLFSGTWLQEEVQAGTVAAFRILPTDEAVELLGQEADNGLCLEHEVISFPSYPAEWPLEMLCAAAEHTLQLCVQALQRGIGLKDATPFNILFQGPRPILVDLLSFEKRDLHDPTWLAHGQFVRSFLLPVLVDARYGMPCHSTFLGCRDGLEPEDVYRILGPLARFTPPFLGNVTIPVLLAASAERQSVSIYARKSLANPDQATFVLQTLFSRMVRSIRASSKRRHPGETWSRYNETCTYTPADTAQKTAFVEQFLRSSRPAKVLDVGSNTGHFSFLAAQSGAEVVATDLDPVVVGSLWQRAIAEQANILPLVVNLARPTPALGWRNRETPSFLERAEGHFDAVLMLAVVHHLLVTDQIPLDEIIHQACRLTTEWLVIEYVGPDDPQFERLLRGRGALYRWFNRGVFTMELGKRFEIVLQEEVADSGRWLYLARRRNAS